MFAPQALLAKKVSLFFTPDMDKPVHSKSVNKGKEALAAQGYESHRQSVGTSYNYMLEENPYKGFDKDKMLKNKGVDGFKKQLKDSFEEAGKDGTILLHVNNHGGVVDRTKRIPESVGYSSYDDKKGKDQDLSMAALLDEFKKYPTDRKLKLIGTHCGGGSIHLSTPLVPSKF